MPLKECCVLTLPLMTEPWQDVIIERRFRILEHLQNSLIALEKRKLKNLEHTRAWRDLMERIKGASEKERRKLFGLRRQMLRDAGISEFAFITDMTPMQKHFSTQIAAHVAQHTASDVWRAFEKFLYGSGREVHFKKRGTMDSAANKKAGNAMIYRDGFFIWSGGRPDKKDTTAKTVTLKIKVADPKNEYEREMLKREFRYFRIVRKWMKTRYKYYLQITVAGKPVQKQPPAAEGRVGIDLGTQTIAIASQKEVRLLVLADRIESNHRKLCDIQRQMDASRRATNPDNYAPDGTVRRGVRLMWQKSNRYMRLQGQARELQRKNADIRRYQHCCLANQILQMGSEIYIEPMDFRALQKRAKETKRDERGRYLKKKRFGRSLANRAPAMLREIINSKLEAQGLPTMIEVDKWSYKASQFDHTDQTYVRKKLGWRWNHLSNGDAVQRDLYAAFLLMNASAAKERIDVDLCNETYPNFKQMHDREIERIRSDGHRVPSSFGITKKVRTAS